MLSKYMKAWGIVIISKNRTVERSCVIHGTQYDTETLAGVEHFMASNNDCGVREYDMEKFQLLNHFRFPWPVNVSLLSI
jgi:hypothetical protein